MLLSNLTRTEVLKHLELLKPEIDFHRRLSNKQNYLLRQIEDVVEYGFIDEIKHRQKRLSRLTVDGHGYLPAWGGELTPGCKTCLHGSGLRSIRSVSECNLSCKFCYYANNDEDLMPTSSYHFLVNDSHVTTDDIKIMIDKQGKKLTGLAWVYRELFLDFDKHPELFRYIHDKGIHQWMYTNGTLITEDHMKAMQDAGFEEIRFDLAASNCGSGVIRKMKLARKYFKYLCVEGPMYPVYSQQLVDKREQILDTGLDQINCAELHLRPGALNDFDDGQLYKYKAGYVSPMYSRRLTYDLMDLAEAENWQNVVINDCSNQLKYYRSVPEEDYYNTKFGETQWGSDGVFFGSQWYVDRVKAFPDNVFSPLTNGKIQAV